MRLGIYVTITALQVAGMLATVAMVGKPRKPLTGGIAVGGVCLSAVIMLGTYYLYRSGS